jgi:4-cresol dehydrogenase (hydroxylating)
VDKLHLAVEAWKGIVGEEWVFLDAAPRERYAKTTSSSSRMPAAILKPADRNQVSAIIRVARQYGVPLYPISTGKNWGYGDACAVYDDQVIVDLSRMNRIIEVNAVLGYAVVEPGVTQGDLAKYLQEHNLPYWVDCSGSGPNCSMIGNMVERGFGHSPYGDRFKTISGMEIVLGTGEVLKTGFGHYENSKVTHLYPYGIGPYLDGIFTQSNFGIVTQMGIWLLPIPEKLTLFVIRFFSNEDFYKAIPFLQDLRTRHILQSISHLGNDMRALSGFIPFPWNEVAEGEIRLPSELRAKLRKKFGLGHWSMSGAFYGSGADIELRISALQRSLQGVNANILVVPQWLLKTMRFFKPLISRFKSTRVIRQKVEMLEMLSDLHSGKPTAAFLQSCFWRKRQGAPLYTDENTDLSQEGVGLMWMTPIIPFTGVDLKRAIEESDKIFAEYHQESHITVNMITERALAAVFSIDYDPNSEVESKAAHECYVKCVKKFFELGYPIYRAAIFGMPLIVDKEDSFWITVASLKKALDPDGIIAPGRYDTNAV